MAKNLLKKYIWLIGTIYDAGKISLEEINNKWEVSSLRDEETEDKRIPRRTFHNWRAVIEELFDVEIKCDKLDGYKYYIANAEDIKDEKMTSWLLNTMAVSNMIHESQSIKNRIILEDIPSGKKFLVEIIEAIKNNKVVEFQHQTFYSDKIRLFHIEPYCVRERKCRWYIVGRSVEENRILVFGLDRILRLNIMHQTFEMPEDFDAEAYFSDFYGVVVDKSVPLEKVQLKVCDLYRKYLRTLPLHHSQKEVIEEDSFSVFEYEIRPTPDFIEELLRMNENVAVLQPKWLADKLTKVTTGDV